ncbi:MAG: urea carboxylase, partial [Alcanivorax sp.]|nr:urea carboxylase [Alcanivorax sp.]
MIKESPRQPEQASFREVVAAGDYFIHTVKK